MEWRQFEFNERKRLLAKILKDRLPRVRSFNSFLQHHRCRQHVANTAFTWYGTTQANIPSVPQRPASTNFFPILFAASRLQFLAFQDNVTGDNCVAVHLASKLMIDVHAKLAHGFQVAPSFNIVVKCILARL